MTTEINRRTMVYFNYRGEFPKGDLYAIFRKRSFKYDYWAGIHQKVPAWSLTTSREVFLVKLPELNLVPREGFYFTLYVNQDSKATNLKMEGGQR